MSAWQQSPRAIDLTRQREARISGAQLIIEIALLHRVTPAHIQQIKSECGYPWNPAQSLYQLDRQAQQALTLCARLIGCTVTAGADYAQTIKRLREMITWHLELQQVSGPHDMGLTGTL